MRSKEAFAYSRSTGIFAQLQRIIQRPAAE
jgi:hypothetical protein